MNTLNKEEFIAVCDALNAFSTCPNDMQGYRIDYADWKQHIVSNVFEIIQLGDLRHHGFNCSDISLATKLDSLDNSEFEKVMREVADFWGMPHARLIPRLRTKEQKDFTAIDWFRIPNLNVVGADYQAGF
ncbi:MULTISPECIES: hypothetical protein [unclassified Oleiphilus]|uniref:hypothetical protein n=1 Tax=unclassified Oleiphilus TaxID=2631174 RepID=UPI0007C3482F|nr:MULTISPECIES: hypothetical protein [unclassified Oleiphilus]KZY32534.1 hypothetical protein A3729_07710 [Oleiphilus sp. HI0043]KZZ67589.1 hypothetical protein A3763_15855 [Oleiphilus sp. HI0128]